MVYTIVVEYNEWWLYHNAWKTALCSILIICTVIWEDINVIISH